MSQLAESKQKKAEFTVTQTILIVPGQVLAGKLFIISPGPNKNRGCGEPFVLFLAIWESNFKCIDANNFFKWVYSVVF